MTIVIIEGPEKAGKSTLIRAVRDQLAALSIDTRIRKFGPTVIDDREYTPALIQDNNALQTVSLWDRGWASEHVYTYLRKESKRLARDPWLGEWLHGRAADIKIMLMPVAEESAIRRRTPDDAQVDPKQEIALFRAYARRFKWKVLKNDYTQEGLANNVSRIVAAITSTHPRNVAIECGPKQSKRGVLFLNNYAPPVFKRDYSTRIPGTWLPFTDVEGIEYGRHLGDEGLAATWASPVEGYPIDHSLFYEVVTVNSTYQPAPDDAWLKLERLWNGFEPSTLHK